MSDRAIGIALAVSVVLGCGPAVNPPSEPEWSAELQALIDSVVADDPEIPGAALAVISPTLGVFWEGASGLADPESMTPMTAADPVRLASNTKTYVAAAILRLVEDGCLVLDSAIGDHLPDELRALLEEDGYDSRAITVRHLLTHTGGLADHGAAEAYTEAILADPTHRWTPNEQVAFMVEWGEPYGPPGTIYSYSDTGYVLLGTILERVSGHDLASAVRELVGFDRLGLESTWWEILEPAPEGVPDRAHQFYGETDVTSFLPYYDLYGGGGIVATVGDLARFFGAIFRGGVFADPRTKETMLGTLDGLGSAPEATERALPPGAYRMGLWVLETDGLITYHHTGFWGTMAVHVPDLDLTMAATGNQNQMGPVFDRIPSQVIAIAKKLEPSG
jgi:D-alanyl-D-alanine carboxypeptidase